MAALFVLIGLLTFCINPIVGGFFLLAAIAWTVVFNGSK